MHTHPRFTPPTPKVTQAWSPPVPSHAPLPRDVLKGSASRIWDPSHFKVAHLEFEPAASNPLYIYRPYPTPDHPSSQDLLFPKWTAHAHERRGLEEILYRTTLDSQTYGTPRHMTRLRLAGVYQDACRTAERKLNPKRTPTSGAQTVLPPVRTRCHCDSGPLPRRIWMWLPQLRSW
jgi:hypothetical protein